MHHLKRLPNLFLVLALAFLVACSNMAGRSFNDYAADTLQAADAVVTTTRTLLAAKKITPDDAENVYKAATAAREGVAVARGVAVSQGADAGAARLRTAAAALDAINAYLAKKGS